MNGTVEMAVTQWSAEIPWRGVGEEKEEALEANEQQDQTARGGDDAKNKTEHS